MNTHSLRQWAKSYLAGHFMADLGRLDELDGILNDIK